MRNIRMITEWNELNRDYESLLERVDKVLSYIEKKGDNYGWEMDKKMPDRLNKRQISKIYKILKGEWLWDMMNQNQIS